MQTVSGIEPSGNNQNGNQNEHGFIFSLILVLGVEWLSGWVEPGPVS
jgi:hypothetical protein